MSITRRPGRRSLVWGLQFHPEVGDGHDRMWSAFVAAAAAHAPVDRPWINGDRSLPTCGVVRTPLPDDDRRSRAALDRRLGSGFGDHRASDVAGHKHAGIDLETTPGEDVIAICPGEVVDIHLAFPHTAVVVAHRLADGTERYSAYKHVADLGVAVGDRVHEWTRIGRVFDVDEQRLAPWRGNHLHFEIRLDIRDGGRASWTSMDLEALTRYAEDPLVFFSEHLR